MYYDTYDTKYSLKYVAFADRTEAVNFSIATWKSVNVKNYIECQYMKLPTVSYFHIFRYWPGSFFMFCKKRTRLISSHLDWTSLVNDGFTTVSYSNKNLALIRIKEGLFICMLWEREPTVMVHACCSFNKLKNDVIWEVYNDG